MRAYPGAVRNDGPTQRGPLGRLLRTLPGTGRVEWIGVSSGRRASIQTPPRAWLEAGAGLADDHHGSRGGDRQVTLIQSEHLAVIGALTGSRDGDTSSNCGVDPALLRRNLVISGVNVLALKSLRFAVGDALLEGTGPCAPCSRMEETLGTGGYQAMRGHGGITARVLRSGWVRLGDELRAASDE